MYSNCRGTWVVPWSDYSAANCRVSHRARQMFLGSKQGLQNSWAYVPLFVPLFSVPLRLVGVVVANRWNKNKHTVVGHHCTALSLRPWHSVLLWAATVACPAHCLVSTSASRVPCWLGHVWMPRLPQWVATLTCFLATSGPLQAACVIGGAHMSLPRSTPPSHV